MSVPVPEWIPQLGQEFDARTGRSDGNHVVSTLHTEMDRETREWLRDCIWDYWGRIPLADWPQRASDFAFYECQLKCGLHGAVFGARIAEGDGLISTKDISWFRGWLLRLIMGPEGEQQYGADARSLSDIDHEVQTSHFVWTLHSLLPRFEGGKMTLLLFSATHFLRLRSVLLRALRGSEDFESIKSAASSRERQIREAISNYVSGGGTVYVLEREGGAKTIANIQVGESRAFAFWTTRQAAERWDAHTGSRHRACEMSYRELVGQLKALSERGVRIGVLDASEDGAGKVCPLDSFERVIRLAIERFEATEMGKHLKSGFEATEMGKHLKSGFEAGEDYP